jgi:hypothetical protein
MELTSYNSFDSLRPSFIITKKTTVNPIRRPMMLTSLRAIRVTRITASIANLKILKMTTFAVGL